MVSADHVELPRTGLTDNAEMVARVDRIPSSRIAGRICDGDGIDNRAGLSEEQATTLIGRLPARVREDGGLDRTRDCHTSTTIAMPIPPPMHRLATPRPPPRLRSA